VAAQRKNSLVANINRRKKAGKSRPKSRSTISEGAYAEMRRGWPSSRKAKRKKARSKARAKKKA
jgi:hypothetical protein